MTKSIEDFFEAWTNTDADARVALISGAVADGASYADPRTEAPMTDVSAMADYVGNFASMGMPVTVTNESATLNFMRATVQFGAGEQSQSGQYTVDLDADGKITRMVGFAGMGA